jgi:hypothetical protein
MRTVFIHGLVGPLFGGEQPLFRLPPPPVDAKTLEQRLRQPYVTRNLSLAFTNVQDHSRAVDVGNFQ